MWIKLGPRLGLNIVQLLTSLIRQKKYFVCLNNLYNELGSRDNAARRGCVSRQKTE